MKSECHFSKSPKPLDFSFGHHNLSQDIFEQPISNQYDFIKSLLDKYARKPTPQPQMQQTKLHSQFIPAEEEQQQMLLPSPEMPHKKIQPPIPAPTQDWDQICFSEEISELDIMQDEEHNQLKKYFQNNQHQSNTHFISDSIDSKIKAELDRTHKRLLQKFTSPLQIKSHLPQFEQKQIKTQNLPHKNQLHKTSQQDKSALSTHISNTCSIPLIESILLSNLPSTSKSEIQIPQKKVSPTHELSEFRIPDAEVKFEKNCSDDEKPDSAFESIKSDISRKSIENVGANEEKWERRMTMFWCIFIVVLLILLWQQNYEEE